MPTTKILKLHIQGHKINKQELFDFLAEVPSGVDITYQAHNATDQRDASSLTLSATLPLSSPGRRTR